MGSITRSFANNITTSGVLLPASLNNNSIANVTSYNAAIATGNMVLISSQTASSSASISFTTGIDSTYKEYQFWFVNCHPQTDSTLFSFQTSTNGGSSYGVTTTSTHFHAYHNETATGSDLRYHAPEDLAQSTSYIPLAHTGVGNDNDQSLNGILQLFNPSSTTYVKHYISRTSVSHPSEYELDIFVAGYFNTTSAINAIQFKFDSGNFDDGTILMYGIK
jgi:hypothetical protein